MWQCEIRHDELHKYRVVKGETQAIMQLRAEMQMRSWKEQWERVEASRAKRQVQLRAAYAKETNKQTAADRTREAQEALDALESLLTNVLEMDHTINWEQLKDHSPFPVPQPVRVMDTPVPTEPSVRDVQFQPELNFITRLIRPIRDKEQARVARIFQGARQAWLSAKAETERRNKERLQQFEKAYAAWEVSKAEWLEEHRKRDAAVDESTRAYLDRRPESIPEYCKMVLSASKYPDTFPSDASIDFVEDTRMAVVDYCLPDIGTLPTLKEVKYIASRDAFQEVHVNEAWLNRTYDSVLYQIALRSLYELFQADAASAIDAIVFNGWVNSIDKATGKEVNACVLSIQATKSEFMDINLGQVDAKACFKKLKGVSATKLTALQPVRPILQLNKEDKRFIPAYNVAETLDGSSNLAAMDWEDFEHLIRQLFEEEFSTEGGEVKITQASRDGGVDAVVFDPDPIRGGKIVIQAKRYTNTVSVSAVRDLFGKLHLTRSSAFGRQKCRAAHYKAPTASTRSGNIKAIEIVKKLHSSRSVFGCRSRQRVDNHRCFLTLKLVNRPYGLRTGRKEPCSLG
jgi:restriction system protein